MQLLSKVMQLTGNPCSAARKLEFVFERLNRSPRGNTETKLSSIGYGDKRSSREAMFRRLEKPWGALRST